MIDEFKDVKMVWAAPVRFVKNGIVKPKYKIFSQYIEALNYCQPPVLKTVTAVNKSILWELITEAGYNFQEVIKSLVKIQFILDPINNIKDKYLVILFKYKYSYYIINDIPSYTNIRGKNKEIVALIKNEINRYCDPFPKKITV